MIIFDSEEDLLQFEDLMESSLTRVWKKVAKPDIDSYINEKSEQIEKNTQSILIMKYVIAGLMMLVFSSFFM
jgi:hypothetical protein